MSLYFVPVFAHALPPSLKSTTLGCAVIKSAASAPAVPPNVTREHLRCCNPLRSPTDQPIPPCANHRPRINGQMGPIVRNSRSQSFRKFPHRACFFPVMMRLRRSRFARGTRSLFSHQRYANCWRGGGVPCASRCWQPGTADSPSHFSFSSLPPLPRQLKPGWLRSESICVALSRQDTSTIVVVYLEAHGLRWLLS